MSSLLFLDLMNLKLAQIDTADYFSWVEGSENVCNYYLIFEKFYIVCLLPILSRLFNICI